MKKNKKDGLQKVTKSDDKLRRLLRRKQITMDDIDQLSPTEKKRLGELTTELIKKTKGPDRDAILKKIDAVVDDQTKTEFWEYNHTRIMFAISSYLNEFGRMPSRTEIALRTDLSRQTVYKHLKDYSNNPVYLEQMQKFRILSTNVIAKVYQSAMAGDIGSQKLYFNVLGFLNNGQIKNQNNYIQINGMVISQDTIKSLNPEQLVMIENLLKSILPEPGATPIEATNQIENLI